MVLEDTLPEAEEIAVAENCEEHVDFHCSILSPYYSSIWWEEYWHRIAASVYRGCTHSLAQDSDSCLCYICHMLTTPVYS